MKVRSSVKPICEKCKVIKRKGRIMIICAAILCISLIQIVFVCEIGKFLLFFIPICNGSGILYRHFFTAAEFGLSQIPPSHYMV